jgi:hypothetical protein
MSRNWLRTASLSAFLIGGAGLGGLAEAKPQSSTDLAKKPIAQASPRKVVKETRVRGSQGIKAPGVKVYRDPDTGQIREATHEEAQALEAHKSHANDGARTVAAPLRQLQYSDGSVAIELSEDYMTDVVVERASDGTLHTRCVPAGERTDAPTTSAQPQLETE